MNGSFFLWVSRIPPAGDSGGDRLQTPQAVRRLIRQDEAGCVVANRHPAVLFTQKPPYAIHAEDDVVLVRVRPRVPGVGGDLLEAEADSAVFSINLREFTALTFGVITLIDPIRTAVSWWAQSPEFRKIGWKAHQFLVLLRITFLGKFDDADPHPAPFVEPFTVKTQRADCFFCGSSQSLNCSIGANTDLVGRQRLAWVRQFLRSLESITGSAGEQQVVIVSALRRTQRLRTKMIQVELTNRATPLLARQTIDATETELIPKPRPKPPVVRVTCRPVSPCMSGLRIAKCGHRRFLFPFCCCSRLFNSFLCSLRASSIGNGATASRYSLARR